MKSVMSILFQAIEYARQVPKPKTVFQTSPGGQQSPPRLNALDQNEGTLDWDLLNTLKERHEREKALVAELSLTKMG